MIRIDLTETERQSGYMTPAHLAQAIAALADDGLVALPAVVNPTHLDILNERMADDLVYFKRRHAVDLNYQGLNPPPFRPYLFKDILLNVLVIQVTHAALGDDVVGEMADFAAGALQRRHLHAAVVVEMHVQRRQRQVVMAVEILHQPLRQVARGVIIDIDQRGHALP